MLAALFVAEGSAAPNSLTCEGYPQARVFVDAQSWWRTTPGMSGTDFGHVHVGGCIPERETLSENTQLDVRVMLHDNPASSTSSSSSTMVRITRPMSSFPRLHRSHAQTRGPANAGCRCLSTSRSSTTPGFRNYASEPSRTCPAATT